MKRYFLYVTLLISLVITSCYNKPVAPTPVISNTKTIQKIIMIHDEMNRIVQNQTDELVAMDSALVESLEYSQLIRLYTNRDEKGYQLSNKLDSSLHLIQDHISSLEESNSKLVNDTIITTDLLNDALMKGIAKDKETESLYKSTEDLKNQRDEQVRKNVDLKEDLASALGYKHLVIGLLIAAGGLCVFKIVLTIFKI